MAEAGFPSPATQTTATPAPNVTPVSTIPSPSPIEPNDLIVRFDPEYLTTAPGVVKIVQISLSLLGFICVQAALMRSTPIGKYYSWISMIAVCFSGTLLGLYLFHVVEKYQHKVPWLKIELAFSGIWTIFFLIAASLTMGQYGDVPLIVAGNFALRTTVAYGIDFYMKWGGVKRGHLAQRKYVECQYPAAAAVNTAVVSVFTVRSSTLQQC